MDKEGKMDEDTAFLVEVARDVAGARRDEADKDAMIKELEAQPLEDIGRHNEMVERIEDQNSQIEVLQRQLSEVLDELDKHHAPPGQVLSDRIRQMAVQHQIVLDEKSALIETLRTPKDDRRERLPIERDSINHKFHVGGQKCWLIVGMYPDGRPGEIFLNMGKPQAVSELIQIDREALGEATYETFRRKQPDLKFYDWSDCTDSEREVYRAIGERLFWMGVDAASTTEQTWSMLRGFSDAVAILTSLLLQYRVPLRDIAKKQVATRFEPDGLTGNPRIPNAKSVLDYVFRWMLDRFDPSHDDGGKA